MRLLLVEDNPKLSALLVELLRSQSYAVDAVTTLDDARTALRVGPYDLVILDLGLPDSDGGVLLREVRGSGGSVPILVATARIDVMQRVSTLDEGADDYLVKPFAPQELLARVRALLRRPSQTLAPIITAGNVALDTTKIAVSIDGRPVDMPRREVAVLEVLMRRQGQVVPRQVLENAVYSLDDEVTPNAIEAAVSRVRKRLELNAANVAITNMRGLGYILTDKAA